MNAIECFASSFCIAPSIFSRTTAFYWVDTITMLMTVDVIMEIIPRFNNGIILYNALSHGLLFRYFIVGPQLLTEIKNWFTSNFQSNPSFKSRLGFPFVNTEKTSFTKKERLIFSIRLYGPDSFQFKNQFVL